LLRAHAPLVPQQPDLELKLKLKGSDQCEDHVVYNRDGEVLHEKEEQAALRGATVRWGREQT